MIEIDDDECCFLIFVSARMPEISLLNGRSHANNVVRDETFLRLIQTCSYAHGRTKRHGSVERNDLAHLFFHYEYMATVISWITFLLLLFNKNKKITKTKK